MATADWDRVKQLFLTALDLPVEERAAFVERETAGDPGLRKTVNDMLAEHEEGLEPSQLNPSSRCVFQDGDIVAGRFRIRRFIARGGMGEVYEAEDLCLRAHRLALKTMRQELMATEEARERFRREILIAKTLSHENLCRVFDLVEHHLPPDSAGGAPRVIPCLTMELVRGESLAHYLQRCRPLGLETALILAHQIGAGLDALHSHGVIHRDLKPSNIMVSERRDGTLRTVVTDFGLAKVKDVESELYESLADVQAGAPFFMAPELLSGGTPSVASDLYAFGLIIDELVTTSRAFAVSSIHALYFAKLHEEPIPPGERSEALPDHWQQTILRCLSRSPDQRPRSVNDVLLALNGADASTTPPPAWSSALPPKPPRTLVQRLVRSSALRWFTAVCSIFGLLIAVSNRLLSREPSGATVELHALENSIDDPQWALFSDELLRVLAQEMHAIEGVRVLSQAQDVASSSKDTRFSMFGTLRILNNRPRLTLSLTDNRRGAPIWFEAFANDDPSNQPRWQSLIVHRAVEELKRQLASAAETAWPSSVVQIASLLEGPSAVHSSSERASQAVLDQYMRSRSLLEEVSPDSTAAAIRSLDRLVKQTPGFALGWAAMADAYLMQMNWSNGEDSRLVDAALRSAERAIQLDPNLAEAHLSLAAIRQKAWDWAGSESGYQRALQLRPDLARGHRWYAGLVLQFGRTEEAIAQARDAVELDPYDRSSKLSLGYILLFSGRCAEAADVLSNLVDTHDMAGARYVLSQSYACLADASTGPERQTLFAKALREAAAIARLEKASALPTEASRPLLSDRIYSQVLAMKGDYQQAASYIQHVQEDVAARRLSACELAWVYTAMGRDADALDLLENSVRQHERGVLTIKVDPFLSRLRSYSRFQELIRLMRL